MAIREGEDDDEDEDEDEDEVGAVTRVLVIMGGEVILPAVVAKMVVEVWSRWRGRARLAQGPTYDGRIGEDNCE